MPGLAEQRQDRRHQRRRRLRAAGAFVRQTRARARASAMLMRSVAVSKASRVVMRRGGASPEPRAESAAVAESRAMRRRVACASLDYAPRRMRSSTHAPRLLGAALVAAR